MTKWYYYPHWRLLDTKPASGFSHMALDQALLESAVRREFVPTLRFYPWSPPALSIGRFQDISDIDLEACAGEGVDVVRRPTGGKCILHLEDFTYSIVFPAFFVLPENVVEAYTLICGGILAALERLGLRAAIQSREHDDYSRGRGACFAAVTQADLEYRGRKICGSAQVRRRGAVLQHGTMLLKDRSELLFKLLQFGDEGEREKALAGYRERCFSLSETGRSFTWDEMAGAFREAFRAVYGVEIEEGDLSASEEARWKALTAAYSSPRWLLNARADDFPLPVESLQPPSI